MQGLVGESPQAGLSLNPPPSFRVLKRGLAQFDPADRNKVLQAIQTAREILDKVTQPGEALFAREMQSFFGPEYRGKLGDIKETWRRTNQLLKEYDSPYPGHDKLYRVTENKMNALAHIKRNDFQGGLFFHDLFFENFVPNETRAATIIHELSHLCRASQARSVGAGTQDFFYLIYTKPMDDSLKITFEGKLAGSDLIDTIGLFNEIAIKEQLNIISVNNTSMTFLDQGCRGSLTREEAIERFNKSPSLRAQVAAKNADSIAYSAIKMANRL